MVESWPTVILNYVVNTCVVELFGATMRLAVCILRDILLFGLIFALLVTADEDSDFEDDLASEEFDDVPPSHTHDHDDETIESVKPLERVSISAFCS